MQASVVIPVWNGASVLARCLDALYERSGDELLEVVCVDNDSEDGSADLIAECFPQVRLIRQPVNLGFAGGVNSGIAVAGGDLLVLLNQDCVVHAGWLAAIASALRDHPEFGMAGCTILDPDGRVTHTGALIRRPDAYGVHLTDVGGSEPQQVDYVTGAAFALRRETWNAVGRFDEGYYPAYYEESDYCYRARSKGIETAYVPGARVTHLLSSREWQEDPVRHAANQHLSRYRFVSKHFGSDEMREFLDAECAAIAQECYFAQAVGRAIGARDTLRQLADILERRRADLGQITRPTRQRQLQVGFTRVLRQSLAVAEDLAPGRFNGCLSGGEKDDVGLSQDSDALERRQHKLLARIYFRPPSDDRSEFVLHRLLRLFVLRPLSFLIGRDYLLLAELNTTHVARLDRLSRRMERLSRRMERMDKRLVLLDTLAKHDYR